MELDQLTKELLRKALDAHQHCGHTGAEVCNFLIVCEAAFLRERTFEKNEELEAVQIFLTDIVLENLILKGVVETTGLTEDGEFLLGLTDLGEDVYHASCCDEAWPCSHLRDRGTK